MFKNFSQRPHAAKPMTNEFPFIIPSDIQISYVTRVSN